MKDCNSIGMSNSHLGQLLYFMASYIEVVYKI